MPSERDVDNYINEIEEKNQIYMEEELKYALKCHNLEEQLGCPLDVVSKALKQGIYTEKIDNTLLISKDVSLKHNGNQFVFILEHCYCVVIKNYKKTW